MPPKAASPCDTPRAFFVALQVHNRNDYINGNGECLVCRHSVATHVVGAAEPRAAAVDVYLGAAYAAPVDPGQAFRETMAEFKEGPFCSDDTDVIKSSVSALSASMHDGTSSFINDTFVLSGPCDLTRKFVLRENLNVDVAEVQTRARNIKAIELVGQKFIEGVLKPTARYRHFVQEVELPVSRDPNGLSSEIKALEHILKRKIVPRTGIIMPSSRHWSTPDQVVYFGLWFATCPSSQLISAVEELVIAIGKAHKTEYPDSFWDKATHKYKYAKLASPSPSPSPGKRPREGQQIPLPLEKKKTKRNDPNSPYMKYTAEERRAHGLAKKAEREALLASGGNPSDAPSSAASSTASLASTLSLGGASASSAGSSQHHSWRAPLGGRGGRDGAGRGRGGRN